MGGKSTGALFVQRRHERQEYAAQPHPVVRRNPPALSLEKSENHPIRFMCEDARGCVRIYFVGGGIAERS